MQQRQTLRQLSKRLLCDSKWLPGRSVNPSHVSTSQTQMIHDCNLSHETSHGPFGLLQNSKLQPLS